MNNRDKLWTVAHDIIEMFSKDFGPFKNMALRICIRLHIPDER